MDITKATFLNNKLTLAVSSLVKRHTYVIMGLFFAPYGSVLGLFFGVKMGLFGVRFLEFWVCLNNWEHWSCEWSQYFTTCIELPVVAILYNLYRVASGRNTLQLV